MKLKSILFLFIPFLSHSQNHVIIDSTTNKPIPYVNIKFVNSNKGFYSDEQGFFFIKKQSNDSVFISCLGYSRVIKRINQLNDTIFLNPKIENLDIIIIRNSSPIIKKIGFKKKNIHWYGISNLQLGLLVKPIKKYENVAIQTILIPTELSPSFIKYIGDDVDENFKSVFKVSLFSIKNNLPDKSLLESPIIVNYNQDSKKIVHVDISKEGIQFNGEGVFICLEMVGEVDAKGAVVNLQKSRPGIEFTNKKTKDFAYSKMFYKTKTSAKWEELDAKKMHFKKDIFLAIQLVLAIYED